MAGGRFPQEGEAVPAEEPEGGPRLPQGCQGHQHPEDPGEVLPREPPGQGDPPQQPQHPAPGYRQGGGEEIGRASWRERVLIQV